MVLEGMGYRQVYTLLEGLDAWKDEVLFPVQPLNPTPDEARRFAEAVALARFFGGQPRAAAAGTDATLAALPELTPAPPAVAAPALPSGGAAPAKKKRREGC
jgi:hypothetical protein